jgi:FkbM family methyltransferase
VINRVYSTVVRSGDVAVDGGAHKGLHTIPLARLVGSSGEVLAIEALPHLARALSESREVQALGNINVAALAVSEQAGRTTFHWVPEAEGYSGIRKRPYPDEVVPQLIEVDVSTIDTLLFGEKRPVSFIKLDLEGGEFFALRGACETLQTHRPVIVFEFGREATASEWGFSKDDFFDFFHQQRYETRDIFMREFDRDSWSKPETPWYLLGIPSELDHLGLTAVVDQFLRQQLDRS